MDEQGPYRAGDSFTLTSKATLCLSHWESAVANAAHAAGKAEGVAEGKAMIDGGPTSEAFTMVCCERDELHAALLAAEARGRELGEALKLAKPYIQGAADCSGEGGAAAEDWPIIERALSLPASDALARHDAGVRAAAFREAQGLAISERKAWTDTTHYDQGSDEANALRKERHLAVSDALDNLTHRLGSEAKDAESAAPSSGEGER